MTSAGSDTPFPPLPEAAWTVRADRAWTAARPNHDKPEVCDPPHAGVPFGGLGAGTVSRSPRGDFVRWHLHAGRHTYRPLPAFANLLAVHDGDRLVDATVPAPRPDDGTLAAWRFDRGHVTHSLYPFAWMEGDAAHGAIRWRLTQFSPLVPNDYEVSSFPVAVLRWHLHNAGDRPLTVTGAMSVENLSIVSPGSAPPGRPRHEALVVDGVPVLVLGREGVAPRTDEDGALAIAATGGTPVSVSDFAADGDGAPVWDAITDVSSATIADPSGAAPDPDPTSAEDTAPRRAAGLLGQRITLAAGETRELAFTVTWHFPVFRVGSGRGWYRRHTRFVGREVGPATADAPVVRLALRGLGERDAWERSLHAFQAPILARRPPALARCLFNHLYILADGGTIWEAGEVDDPGGLPAAPAVPGARDVGRFAILECFTYPFYATLDVRYYGSFPLLFFWPELERQVLLQFADAAGAADAERRQMTHVVEEATRKRAGALPHDLGSPDEDPWVRVNAYDDIDPNRWKDLGPKFVLLATRYLARVGWEDRGFLRAAWPATKGVLDLLDEQDRDRDGLPENEGIPDQTFDKWPMTGPSAYCAGLTLAALTAAEEMARWCGDPGRAGEIEARRRRATHAMRTRLFRGTHLRYDGAPENDAMVMAGQLSGEWSLALAGLPAVLSADEVGTVLDTVVARCTLRSEITGRAMGLVNGAPLGNGPPPDNRHAREMWTGITYGVASHLVLAGRHDAGLAQVEALDALVHETLPFAFSVPEGVSADGRFRGALYLRPLAVWAVEEALRQTHPDPEVPSFLRATGEVHR